MDYALIENEVITNIIWLHPLNEDDFPSAVPIGEVPARIGDSYIDGIFYRNGERVLTALEKANKTIEELDAAIVDLEYNNVLLELGM